MSGWLRSLELHENVAAALAPPEGESEQYSYVRALTLEQLEHRLGRAGLGALAPAVWDGVQSLRRQEAATGLELSAKFASDGGTFQMAFGGLPAFHDGLEGLIGPPTLLGGSVREAMAHEHESSADSAVPFATSNGITGATPSAEWSFVVRPTATGAYVERGGDFRTRHPEWCRRPVPLDEMEERMEHAVNARLRERGHAALELDELIAGRLYTGPMYEKYNAVLRFFSAGRTAYGADEPVPFPQQRAEALALGRFVLHADAAGSGAGRRVWEFHNRYTTTIHAINSCVAKLGRLTSVSTVYRGFRGATLPQAFFEADPEEGFAGGVEFGFSSTTVDRAQAVHYAAGHASTVFEMRMGMVDRGADLAWLSQYPHEREILFPPLLALDALATRVDGSTLVVHARLDVPAAITLEQVVSKRRKLLLDVGASMRLEVRGALQATSEAHFAVGGQPIVCRRSNKPVTGTRYRHRRRGYSLSEEEYTKLPDEPPSADGKGPEVRADYEAVPPPWTPTECGARGELARGLVEVGVALARGPKWFTDDNNFKRALDETLWIKTVTSGAGAHPSRLDLSKSALLAALPDSIRHSKALAHLRMEECEALVSLGDGLGGCEALEELDLAGCRALASLPRSFGRLKALRLLSLRVCSSLTSIAHIGGCSKLERLDLRGATSLTEVPNEIGACDALEVLELGGCTSLSSLGAGIGRCKRLSKLHLTGCTSLTSLPEGGLSGCSALQTLSLGSCSALVSLPADMGLCSALESLNLSQCRALRALPDLRGCAQLSELALNSCDALTSLGSEVAGLAKLKRLRLQQCKALSSMEGFEGCAGLEELNLTQCVSLAALPDGLRDSMALKNLNARDCTSLSSLGEALAGCHGLATLNLEGCSSLALALPISMPVCEQLTYLHLKGCGALTLLANLGGLRRLEYLTLSKCTSLTAIDESIGECASLLSLDASGCTALASLPDGLGRTDLRSILLSGARSLVSLPASLGGCKRLLRVSLSDCEKLEMLPDSLGGCSELCEIHCENCVSLASLPETLAQCPSLSYFELSGCTALKRLPDLSRSGGTLRELRMNGCSALESLPSLGKMEACQELYLAGCSSLASLPLELPPALQLLGAKECTAFTTLPEAIGTCAQLKELELAGCTALTSLPDTIGRCEALAALNLCGCTSLASLPGGLAGCTKLYALNVCECDQLTNLPDLSQLVDLELVRPRGSHLPEHLAEWKQGGYKAIGGAAP